MRLLCAVPRQVLQPVRAPTGGLHMNYNLIDAPHGSFQKNRTLYWYYQITVPAGSGARKGASRIPDQLICRASHASYPGRVSPVLSVRGKYKFDQPNREC